MANKHGNLSINSDNIFPIIKKWLYSDHDIFLRELVSNGCDAVTKLKKLALMGEYTIGDDESFMVNVIPDSEAKTIKFIDNGIGMTAEEVEEYINQIAFSGAEAFLEQYKDKTTDDQIIGHFGLGFYSAFMVADKVEIDTLSYKDGAKAVRWECDGGVEFTMSDSDRSEHGTEITLYLNEDCYEFSNEFRVREVLEKYCSFMPVEIYVETPLVQKEESDKQNDTEDSKENKESEEKPVPINTTTPLWAKHPNECTEEEYKEFYHKTFKDYREPLFWIHLNMDYPFNLKGILYFPKINMEYESINGVIKLYNNQVFIADNIKEVIPEFLMLLKGAIDCPDLPLNVSRSALQNDGFVNKISDYITKKVADKLSGMCKTDRENYEKYWDDINPFIKFGCLNDEKFREKMRDYILFKNLEGKYITLPDCLKENEDKSDKTIYYVTDELQQSQYINMFKESGLDAVILPHPIDQPFISQLEQANENIKFARIDAGVTDSFKEENVDEKEMDEQYKPLIDTFKKIIGNEDLYVIVEKLKNENISSMITLPEENRRMQDMMKAYGVPNMNSSMYTADETLVLNANNSLVKYIFDNPESENVPMICEQLYDLARIAHRPLTSDEMTNFIARSNTILSLLAK
ncbi:MAG: molecular chaperone HtpG [Eubacterium sp.]